MKLLDEWERLRADAEAFARQIAAARAGGRGVDPNGAVEIVLDGDGRPVDVRLRPGWRGAVEPDGLAIAVREAWAAAVLDRLAAWVAAATDPITPARPPGDGEPTRSGAPASGASGGRGLSGRVVVEVSGGEVARLWIDDGWLGSAGDAEVEAAVRAALVDAFDTAGSTGRGAER